MAQMFEEQGSELPTETLSTSQELRQPITIIKTDLDGHLSYLSWDTEGGERAKLNLLKAPIKLVVRIGEARVTPNSLLTVNETDRIEYQLCGHGVSIFWSVTWHSGVIHMSFINNGSTVHIDGLELVIPFDPKATATGPVGGEWTADEKLMLPSLLYAPDMGAMHLSCPSHPETKCRWEGSRGRVGCWATLTIELPSISQADSLELELAPVRLPLPDTLHDKKSWAAARTGWMNLLQTSTKRPAEPQGNGGFYNPTPAGVWANNIISDPVSSTVFWLGHHVLLLPELMPGISALPLLRRSVELWMNDCVTPEGRIYYTMEAHNQFDEEFPMDANPSVLIGAWCYVQASGDTDWLVRCIERLEWISAFTERFDTDGDGLIESPQSGNRGSQAHGETAWDCISTGHKNAYVNALVYRAFRCMSHLEAQLGHKEKSRHYTNLADRLKVAYRDTFYNPDTGWLGWWRSADGELHDVWADMPTSHAVCCGVIDPADGAEMLDRHWEQLGKAGYTHFEVGLPLNLRPIPPSLMLTGFGGQKEDGSDTFGRYLNGGACVSNSSFWLAANYLAGRSERAEMVLTAMLERQSKGVFFNGGAFQNGIIDRYPDGAEFFDWQGNTCGYEGHLVYSWTWMHALFAREGAYHALLVQPLEAGVARE